MAVTDSSQNLQSAWILTQTDQSNVDQPKDQQFCEFSQLWQIQ